MATYCTDRLIRVNYRRRRPAHPNPVRRTLDTGLLAESRISPSTTSTVDEDMTQITSHILDTSRGAPAQGILITLTRQQGDDWLMLGSGSTDEDGRVADFVGSDEVLPAGVYKLTFYLSDYYAQLSQNTFYPYVDVAFEITGDGQHYHVPLLLNPFGYSTYRGS